jgi:hypothetical protein
MKVALYARYSTDNQRDASIADQFRVCPRAFAEKQGRQIVEEYSDHAISGASLLRAGVLTPKDGDLLIDVRSDLAGILAICVKTKTPATRVGESPFEMVAGTCSHLKLLFQATV